MDGNAPLGFNGEVVNPTKQPKRWHRFNAVGHMKTVEIDKYTLATKLQLPLRDLRVLDPLLPTPYPSAIFIRDNSIILNFEHIKMIACANQVWLLDSAQTPAFTLEAEESLESLRKALTVTLRVAESNALDASFRQEDIFRELSHKLSSEDKQMTPEIALSQLLSTDLNLPFELRAVEAALHEFTKFLDAELTTLDEESAVALEALSTQVSRVTLENVRSLKAAMNSLFARVSKTREELERLLDDDEDMSNMYLGSLETKENTQFPLFKIPSANCIQDHVMSQSPPLSMQHEGVDAQVSPKKKSKKSKNKYSRLGASYPNTPFNEVWEDKEVSEQEAVEALLEVYFMKSDFLLKRLGMLKDKIEDYEDFINIDLDSRRNELFKVDILLTCGTMCMGLVSAIVGIFGMNLASGGEPEESKLSHTYFMITTLTVSIACILLFVLLVMYLKYKRLMFVPEPKIVSNSIDRGYNMGRFGGVGATARGLYRSRIPDSGRGHSFISMERGIASRRY